MTDDPCKTKPDIEYPCPWIYRVIGNHESLLRTMIAELLAGRDHQVSLSNRSAKGKYSSLKVELTVTDEADRLRVFAALSAHPSVRVVL